MASEEEVKHLWQTTDCACFDIDSTVCTDEAIDELAKFLGVGDEVAKITNSAMQGSMTYRQSLSARLSLMQPHQNDIKRFIAEHPPRLTPGMKELASSLQQKKIPIYLISGGFTCIVEKVAEALDVPKKNIYANKLLFYYDGSYAGFDKNQPVCETRGKPKVIEQLKEKFGYKRVVHIGDGVTDMEAAPPADAFIGFGGNRIREKVKNGSHWFVTDMKELIDVLCQ